MIIRITDKLGKKIKDSPAKIFPLDENPYIDWTARLFIESRVQYIMITNTMSLYTMIMYGKGITDDFIFINRVTSYMSEYIRDDGFELIWERLIVPRLAKITLSKALNRKVTGSMNELVSQAKMTISNGTVSPWDASDIVNNTRLSYIQYKRPREMFQAMSI